MLVSLVGRFLGERALETVRWFPEKQASVHFPRPDRRFRKKLRDVKAQRYLYKQAGVKNNCNTLSLRAAAFDCGIDSKEPKNFKGKRCFAIY